MIGHDDWSHMIGIHINKWIIMIGILSRILNWYYPIGIMRMVYEYKYTSLVSLV